MSWEERIKMKGTQELEEFMFYFGTLSPGKSYGESELKNIFKVHGEYTGKPSYGYYCGSCRARIYRELTQVNEMVKKELYERGNR